MSAEQSDNFLKAVSMVNLNESGKLEGKILGPENSFMLDKLLRADNHALIFSVRDVATGDLVNSLEARVYQLNDIPSKVRRHRLRNIKRLSNRMIAEIKCEGISIIVYQMDSKSNSHGGIDSETSSSVTSDPSLLRLSPPKLSDIPRGQVMPNIQSPKTKSQRYRAKSKRRIERRERKLEKRLLRRSTLATHEEIKNIVGKTTSKHCGLEDENKVFETLALLNIAYDKHGNLRQQISSRSCQRYSEMVIGDFNGLVSNYVKKRVIEFESSSQMEEYKGIKRDEVLFFLTLLQAMPRIYSNYYLKYHDLLVEQRVSQERSKSWRRTITRTTKKAFTRLKAAIYASRILPQIIDQAEQSFLSFEKRASLVKEKELNIGIRPEIFNDLVKFEKNVNFYAKLEHTLILGSHSRDEARRLRLAAEESLNAFISNNKGAGMEKLLEYQSLLKVHIK